MGAVDIQGQVEAQSGATGNATIAEEAAVNDISGFIRRRLGLGVVDNELTDLQISDAITKSKRWYASHIGQYKVATLIGTGLTEYSVADDVENVVDVTFPTTTDNIFQVFDWAGVQLSIADFVTLRQGGYSILLERLQYWEMIKQIVSSECDWNWDRWRRKLVISPAVPSGTNALYLYSTANIQISRMLAREIQLVQDYALAESMLTLGYIRGKYAGLPSASGDFSLNADTLLANADAMKVELEERIRGLVEPMGIITG